LLSFLSRLFIPVAFVRLLSLTADRAATRCAVQGQLVVGCGRFDAPVHNPAEMMIHASMVASPFVIVFPHLLSDRASSEAPMSFRLQEWALAMYQAAFRVMMSLMEKEFVPDFITRVGIRYLLSLRLRDVRVLAVLCGPQFSGMPLYDI
jgi:hypothetical protein